MLKIQIFIYLIVHVLMQIGLLGKYEKLLLRYPTQYKQHLKNSIGNMYELKQRMLSMYSKNICDSTIRIQSQDFGGNKYSKNIKVTTQIK